MTVGFRLVFSAFFALILSIGVAWAAPVSGALRLDDGSELTWTLSDDTPSPALGLAVPAVIWLDKGQIVGPVKIDLATNYAAWIERWELALYRQTDEDRRHPIREWRGASVSLDAGIVWDGKVANGPGLRPGETVVALFRVRDVAGNIDESLPQTMLVSRYLMPRQQRALDAQTEARRRAVARGDPPAIQTIPMGGRRLDVTVTDRTGDEAMRIAGIAMDAAGSGRWTLSQAMRPGIYSLKVQTERPIIGGTRLISVGRISVAVPEGAERRALVKSVEGLTRGPLATTVEGLTPDGVISGREAVRLPLRQSGAPEGRFTLAILDPTEPVALYRDRLRRSVVAVRPPSLDVPWGSRTRLRKVAEPVKMRVRYDADAGPVFALPHTDLDAERVFVSVRGASGGAVYLKDGEDFDLDRLQGRLVLRAAAQAAAEGGTLEVAYRVQPSLAGLRARQPDGDAFVPEGNGLAEVSLYGAAALAVTSQQDEAAEVGWIARNLEWLTGG